MRTLYDLSCPCLATSDDEVRQKKHGGTLHAAYLNQHASN